jgi:hypothetical protein
MVILRSQPKDSQRAAVVPLIVLLVVLPEELGDREVAPFDPNASRFTDSLKGHETTVGGAHEAVGVIGRFDRPGRRLEFTIEELVEVFYEIRVNTYLA